MFRLRFVFSTTRTQVQHDELNPDWKEETLELRLPLDSREHFKSLSLIVQVMDKDMVSSQLIGSYSMSLEDFVTNNVAHVRLEPLEKYGRKFKRGRLSFTISMKGGANLLRLRCFQSTKPRRTR